MSEWIPVESAPKDGTYVLLCQAIGANNLPIVDEHFGVFVQVAAWWGQEDGEWVVYCSMVQEPRLHFKPTHWMELPKNPTIAKEIVK